jgi:3-hydroxybutyryl-CoA dehydrogenase
MAEEEPALRAGVLGAGQMGVGIAETLARAGHDVRVFEPIAERREASRAVIVRSTLRAHEAGKLSGEEREALLGRIGYVNGMDELSDREIVIEAVLEDEALKLAILAELDAILDPDAVIASNTSSIPIAALASAVRNPGRVLGLHFFAPAPVMAIVEVVRAIETTDETMRFAERLIASLGYTAIAAQDRAGFIVNLLLVPYLNSAVRMLEAGIATREDIDNGMRLGCGHPMGPLTLCDFIGLDVIAGICDSLFEEFKNPEYARPPLLNRMISAGRLGRKSGRGFYEYS